LDGLIITQRKLLIIIIIKTLTEHAIEIFEILQVILLSARYFNIFESQILGSIVFVIPKYWNIRLGIQDIVNKSNNPVALAHDTSVTCSLPLLAWYNNQVSNVPNCTSLFFMSCLNFRLFCNNHKSLGKICN